MVGATVGDAQESISAAFLQGKMVGKAEARDALSRIIHAMSAVFLDQKSEPWAALMMREQARPTSAFHLIYSKVMGPALATIRHLLAVLIEDRPDSDRVRLRALALVGSVLVFRISHAAVLQQMGWQQIGPENVTAIQAMLDDIVRSIGTEEIMP
jgi:TetR/AcrR family transcriptional regulator, regulator of cefoperazone and chloramphenicol sensitivity